MKIKLFLIFFMISFISYSQNIVGYVKDSIRYNDTFNLNSIKDCILDKNEVLWVSTEFGLYNYDGLNFRKIISAKYPSISKSRISNLARDYHTGDIIFSTYPNYFIYKIHDNNIEKLNYSKYLFSNNQTCILPNNPFSKKILNSIFKKKYGNVDIRTLGDHSIIKSNDSYFISIFNDYCSTITIYKKDGTIKNVGPQNTKKNYLINLQNNIFFINGWKIYNINKNDYKVKLLKIDPIIESFLKEKNNGYTFLNPFFYPVGDNYYLNYKGVVYKVFFDKYLKKSKISTNPENYLTSLYSIKKLDLLICYRYQKDFKILKPIIFNTIAFKNTEKNNCYSVAKYDINKWFCASGWLYDKKNKSKNEFSLKKTNKGFIMNYNGSLYCNDGQILYDIKNNNKLSGYSSKGEISGYCVFKKKLLIIDVKSLHYQFKNSFKLDTFLLKELNKIKNIELNKIFNFNNKLVIGTTEGAFFYSPFSKLTPIEGLKGKYVRYFKYINNYDFWVSCYGDGLFLVHHKKAYKVNDLSYDLSGTHAIEEDSKGYLWISTNSGLLNVNKTDAIKKILKNEPIDCYRFTTADGLPTNEFNGGGTHPSINEADSIIGFTSSKGFVWFQPEKVIKHLYSGGIIINKIVVDGKKINSKHNTYNINPNAQIINFDISFPYYFNRENIVTEYRFSDKTAWFRINNGSFTIARNEKGSKQIIIKVHTRGFDSKYDVIKKVNLYFEYKYYETTWFLITAILALITLVYLSFKLGLLLNKRREKELGEKVKLKTLELQKTALDLELSKDEIVKSLKEKEILIKEIHHRVKNNLQLVISLLNIQGRRKNYKDIEEFIEKGQNRIFSMVLIHNKLYQNESLEDLNIQDYLENLIQSIFVSFGITTDSIKYNINAKDIYLNLHTSIPFGLIINELVTNSLKYAFPNNKNGTICIILRKTTSNKYELIFEDDGIGFDKSNLKKKTFGVELIKLLVNQLGGEVEFFNDTSTQYKITFKEISL